MGVDIFVENFFGRDILEFFFENVFFFRELFVEKVVEFFVEERDYLVVVEIKDVRRYFFFDFVVVVRLLLFIVEEFLVEFFLRFGIDVDFLFFFLYFFEKFNM